jgi:predicted acylesterase/phospholipase RssA
MRATNGPTDVVLSSGFLAFAAHCGFLAGLEDAGVEARAGCGTSSGALVLALWAAGVPAAEILQRTTSRAPLASCRPHLAVWRGLFTLDAVQEELARQLPADFAGLRFPISVGVVGGAHKVVSSGPLVPAVAASCAVPWLFAPVSLGGAPHVDGAVRDRFGWDAFRAGRTGPAVVHAIERSGGHPGEGDFAGAVGVRSPRSGASLWRIPDPQGQFEAARARTRAALGAQGAGGA